MPKEVVRDDYVDVTPNSGRCVDERDGKGSHASNRSVQLPGATSHLMDLMLLAVVRSGKRVGENELFDMVGKVYESQIARMYGAKPGFHIDDEHGRLSLNQTNQRLKGCGQDIVRVSVLEHMGVSVVYESGSRMAEGRKRGWGIQVLTGDHTPGATAAVNSMEGKTLDTSKLWKSDRTPSFNYDWWFANMILEELSKQLYINDYSVASSLLEKNGRGWSLEMYSMTLRGLGHSGNLIQIA